MSEEENLPEEKPTDDNNQLSEINSLQEPEDELQQIENMEVHKHPHHVTHKKKWGEYLLEFLMLFLAVFLGFVAENVRENIIEKERAKQYVESFYEDLKTDTTELNRLFNFETKKIAALNVLHPFYDSLVKNQYTLTELTVIKNSLSNNPFIMNGRTLHQLTNAGGFRLLSQSDGDSIASYDKHGSRLMNYQSTLYQQSQDNLRNTFNEVVDFTAYTKLYTDITNTSVPDAAELKTSVILTSDKALVNKYFNQLFQYLRVIVEHRRGLKSLNEHAARLLDYFKNKYHLQ